jgi:hypothetical protein
MKFFDRNIGKHGRLIRATVAVALLAAGLFISVPNWLRLGLIVAAVFVLFEAVRGWCFLRACGIKTKF